MTASESILRIKEHARLHLKKEPCAVHISEALQMACDALEKQIPKKVVPIQRTAHDFETGVCKHSHFPCEHLKPFNHEYKYTDYKCPVCGKRVSDGKPYSCCHCTQALDWSDTE